MKWAFFIVLFAFSAAQAAETVATRETSTTYKCSYQYSKKMPGQLFSELEECFGTESSDLREAKLSADKTCRKLASAKFQNCYKVELWDDEGHTGLSHDSFLITIPKEKLEATLR